MSAFAMPALALARRAAEGLPALYADLARRSPPPEVVVLDSVGHRVEGTGPARYIADAMCDEALLAAHPGCVFRTANGRIFRLLPMANSLSVEQVGAAGDGLANDQPTIQAAIDYAEVVAARELRFESEHYRIDCPVRTSPLLDTRAEDGHPLVVRRTLAMRGCAPVRSVLDFRGVGGSDPEAEWQPIATSATDPSPTVWRGGGIFLQGDAVYPPPAVLSIAHFELDRLVLKGNRQHTGAYHWPADPVTGDGWDISDKALWLQDCCAGKIVCRDVDMIGWKGEIFYLGGAIDAVEAVELTRCRFLTSNGSAFNPGVNAAILAESCEFGDCFQAQEETGKSHAVYRQCVWRDCHHMTIGSGPTDELIYNFTWPTRDPDVLMPGTRLLDCEFRDIGFVLMASWIRGSIRTFDTTVVLDGTMAQVLQDTDLSIDAWLDRKHGLNAVSLFGLLSLNEQVQGAPNGVYKQPPSHVRVRVRHYRTRNAKDKGFEWYQVSWGGLIDVSCRLECEGDYAQGRTPNGRDDPLSMPFVSFKPGESANAYGPSGFYYGGDVTDLDVLAPAGPCMTIQVTGEVTSDLSLPSHPRGGAQFGYAHGQKVRLIKANNNGQIRFVKTASPTSQAVNETRVLDQEHDWIEFTYNRTRIRWEESGFFSVA